MKKSFPDRFREVIANKDITQTELSKITGITQSSISDWLNGKYLPKQDKIDILAKALDVSPAYLMGWEDDDIDLSKIPGLILPVHMKRIPILGTIACGKPIFADQNYDGYFMIDTNLPEADFVLKAKGDSMIEANIFEGDFVFFRKQRDVDNGTIAAVLIDEEATLKRVNKSNDMLILQPCNKNYEPLIYSKDDDKNIVILGQMVGVYSNRCK